MWKKQNSNQSENGGMKNVKNNDISPQASSQPKSEISDGSSNSRGSRHHNQFLHTFQKNPVYTGHLGHLTQLLKQVIIFHQC
jgi:hypothetical protein